MSVISAGQAGPAHGPEDTATAAHGRRARLRAAAAARGVPLATILVTVVVVVLTYLAGKLAYRLRDVILMILVGGFLALILNPLVVALQRWRIRRRGWAVTIVILWATLVFIGLLAAFGYPLTNGLTHFSHQLPSYVQSAEHGSGWIGHLVQQLENHVLNPVIMSRTVNINPLLVLLSILVGTSIGDWLGGFFGSFVAALISIPVAGALQVLARELWQATASPGPPGGEPPAGPEPPAGDERAPETYDGLSDDWRKADKTELEANGQAP